MTMARLFVLTVCTWIGIIAAAHGATYYIATNGSDTNEGTLDSPFKTIQRGIDAAEPGDTVHAAAGTYQERLTIGAGKDGLVLEGEMGTVLDASDVFEKTWERDKKLGKYDVYTVSLDTYPGEPRAVFFNDRNIPVIDYVNDKSRSSLWYWVKLFKNGLTEGEHNPWYGEPNGWDGIRSLAMYHVDKDKMYIKLKPEGNSGPGISPNSGTVTWADYGTIAIALNGSSNVTIRNFHIKYAFQAMKISHSKGTVIAHNKLAPVLQGIYLFEGADAIEIRNNEITNNFYCDISTWELANDVWHCVKSGGYMTRPGFIDRWAVEMRNSVGNHYIHHNYIHDAWDGISSGWNGTVEEELKYNTNIEVAHNVIENMIDDSLDGGGNYYNHRWHDNLVRNSQQYIRIRHVFQGPFYLYNNIFLNGPLSQQCIMFYGDWKSSKAHVYIYNNTVDESTDTQKNRSCLYVNSDKFDFTNTCIFNNIFYGDNYANARITAETAWRGDYNVFVRKGPEWDPEHNPSWAQDTLKIEQNSHWFTSAPGFADYPADVSLTADSPARGMGADLTKAWGFTPPGNISTDCGALPYGTPMPQYYPFAEEK